MFLDQRKTGLALADHPVLVPANCQETEEALMGFKRIVMFGAVVAMLGVAQSSHAAYTWVEYAIGNLLGKYKIDEVGRNCTFALTSWAPDEALEARNAGRRLPQTITFPGDKTYVIDLGNGVRISIARTFHEEAGAEFTIDVLGGSGSIANQIVEQLMKKYPSLVGRFSIMSSEADQFRKIHLYDFMLRSVPEDWQNFLTEFTDGLAAGT